MVGFKGLRPGVIIGPVVLEARLRKEVFVGLSTLCGEYSDPSAHPSSKGSICGHDDKAFDALLLRHVLHVNNLLGLCTLSLIAIGRHIGHSLAGRIGPPAETVRESIVPSRNVDHNEVKLGQGVVPSGSSGGSI